MLELCALTRRRTTTDKPHTFSSLQRRARRWTVGHLLEPSTVLLISTYCTLLVYQTLFIGFCAPQSQCCTLYHHYNTIYRAEYKYNRYLKSDIFNWGVISLIMLTFQHSSKTIHPGFVYMLWPEENCKDDTFDINC